MNRFEKEIQEWYDKSLSSNLHYLDLATTTKPSNSDLANNIGTIYCNLNLLSRVHLKHDHQVQQRLREQDSKISDLIKDQRKILKAIASLQTEVVNLHPLTVFQVRKLVEELIQEPKEIEKKTAQLLEQTQLQIQKVEEITAKILHDLS